LVSGSAFEEVRRVLSSRKGDLSCRKGDLSCRKGVSVPGREISVLFPFSLALRPPNEHT
jgi:hypothetical protein